MLKRSTFGLAKTKLEQPQVVPGAQSALKIISLPQKASLISPAPVTALGLLPGARINTGQWVSLTKGGPEGLLSTLSGSISHVSRQKGYLGREYLTLAVDVNQDSAVEEVVEDWREKSAEELLPLLAGLPGRSPLACLWEENRPRQIKRLIVSAFDQDPLSFSNRFFLRHEAPKIARALEILKEIWPAANAHVVSPPQLAEAAASCQAEVHPVDAAYPDMLPRLLLKKLFRHELPAGQDPADAGIAFLSTEALCWLADAVEEARPPVEKVVGVQGPSGSLQHAKVRIGTPLAHVLEAMDLEPAAGGRLILGGPLTGKAVSSAQAPILADCSSILLQEPTQVMPPSEAHCVNCGECVRACPADIPVNLLVRVLENGLYEDAARDYDLLSCVDCGLCAVVCIARIPVFHYIALGKAEYARLSQGEVSDVQ